MIQNIQKNCPQHSRWSQKLQEPQLRPTVKLTLKQGFDLETSAIAADSEIQLGGSGGGIRYCQWSNVVVTTGKLGSNFGNGKRLFFAIIANFP